MGYALQQNEFEFVHSLHNQQGVGDELLLQERALNEKFLELNLSQELQSKLDIKSILHCFSNTLSDFVPHSGIRISTLNGHPAEITEGAQGRYQENVDLILNEEKFGTITLMDRKPLNEWAAIFFRYLARYLVYPVKNTLLIQSLQKQALTDPLTGLQNRAALHHDLNLELKLSARSNTPFTLTMIDIDHFKQVNDRYGHPMGDQVLKTVSQIIRQLVRESDGVYRFGGEEFTLLLRNNSMKQGQYKVGSILARSRMRQYTEVDPALRVTLSAGITQWMPGDSMETLLDRADRALYHSKSSGRDQVTTAEELS